MDDRTWTFSCFLVFFVASTILTVTCHNSERFRKSNVAELEASDSSVHHRVKRMVDMNNAQKQELLSIHNFYRSLEGSSDMEHLKWNSDLAMMADEWAKNCQWQHGQPTYDPRPYTYIGQNLYATQTNPLDFTLAIQSFYNEKYDYDYNSNTCNPVKDCSHYTQVVWSDTKEIGCGLATCPGLVGGVQDQYLVCNYGPSGNWAGVLPFVQGPSCTKCASQSSYCLNGLCNQAECDPAMTVSPSPGCECKAACHNCATYVESSCSCVCQTGFKNTD